MWRFLALVQALLLALMLTQRLTDDFALRAPALAPTPALLHHASRMAHARAHLVPAAFEDPAHYYSSNAFLRAWKPSDFAAAARSLIEFRSGAVRLRQEALRSARGHAVFDGAPSTQPCALKRYGETSDPVWGLDGGKWLCDLPALAGAEGCVVYSLGSNGQFEFELEMVARTPCTVHTFDCTLNETTLVLPSSPRIHFHALCAGEGRTGDSRYQSLAALAAGLGHSKVDLLKMDIEGFEYRVVESLYKDVLQGVTGAEQLLPLQISLEVHTQSRVESFPELPWGRAPGLSAVELDAFWVPLTDLGYVVVSREDNRLCKTCSEFTAVRAFVSAPQTQQQL
jgi:hypothetical protein